MAEKEKNNELENMSFEDAINELEKIVDELEGNEISLDEAVNAYERGSKLKNICQERLNEAKMKVEKIRDFDKDEICSNHLGSNMGRKIFYENWKSKTKTYGIEFHPESKSVSLPKLKITEMSDIKIHFNSRCLFDKQTA